MTQIIESFNVDEEFMYSDSYNFIKGFANGRSLNQTLRALPLARKFHNGAHRKGIVIYNDKEYELPYVVHPISVCSRLISYNLPLNNEQLDILLAAALLHDVIEDCEQFLPKGGKELITEYGFRPEVYEAVKLVSKKKGLNDEQLLEYFNKIKRNIYALLIKCTDRADNVEDLYNMKNIHKYIRETQMFIYPLIMYGKQNYPEISNALTIIKANIEPLVTSADIFTQNYETMVAAKDAEIEKLKAQLNKK